MKKLFIACVLFVLTAIPTSLYAQNNTVSGAMMIQNTDVVKTKKGINPNLFLLGEAGFMAGGEGLGHDFMFTAGYRFKERFIAGVGLGYFGKYGYAYPGFILYGYGRADILKNRKITPFVSLYLGGNIPWGVYISPMIGVKLPISQSIKLNISTGLAAATVQEYYGYAHTERYTTVYWSLRVGVEF